MRAVSVAVSLLLIVTPGLRGQPPDFSDSSKQPGWVDQLGPGGLVGWEVRGGQRVDKDSIHLGGGPMTTARLLAPLSERFKLYLEFEATDPRAMSMRFHREGFFSGGFVQRQFSSAGAGQLVQLSIGAEPGHGEQYEVRVRERFNNGEASWSTSSRGTIGSIEIEIPAGQTLSIRKLRLFGASAAAPAGQPLYPALAALTVFLLGVMGLGWFLNRRRPAAASARSSAP